MAQWQLFFTLFAALAMKVNMDNENLQNRVYFDMVLSAIQFVPVLIVTVTNFINARNATKAAKSLLGGGSNDDSGGGLEMGEITLNPLPDGALGKKSLPPHLARVQAFKRESKTALANPFARSLSKEETSLGGEVVSKHKKVEKRETTLHNVKEEEGEVGTDNKTWLKRHD